MGLDEAAMESVSKWRFKPAMKAGQPVTVDATVEVNFRLLDAPDPSPTPPPSTATEVTPPKSTPQRIRVGGNVQAAKIVKSVAPKYPPLALQARIQGTVRFMAIIGKDGTIQNLQPQSGHPLLVQAATDAVRQWVYSPTLFNGEPVEVVTQIDVNFTLTTDDKN
jgi:protein TonB